MLISISLSAYCSPLNPFELGGKIQIRERAETTAADLYKLAEYQYKEGKITEAIEKYKEAAGKKYIPAYKKLADIYWNRGNTTNAIEYYTKSHKAGDVESTYMLAEVYDQGKGVAQDFQKARELYLQAARKEHLEAALKYIEYCKEGKGSFRVDRSEAKKWENKEFVRKYFEEIEKKAKEEEERLKREAELCKSLKEARICFKSKDFKTAIEKYHHIIKEYGEENLISDDMYFLGLIYSGEEGGGYFDKKQRNEWMKKAAEQGHQKAEYYYKKYCR